MGADYLLRSLAGVVPDGRFCNASTRFGVVGTTSICPKAREQESGNHYRGNAYRASTPDRYRQAARICCKPCARIADQRAGEIADHLDARQPATHGVGDGLIPYRAAE